MGVGERKGVSGKPRTHRKMRKLETPNMMKVIPVPRATIARVESGAEGESGTLRKAVCGVGGMGRVMLREQGADRPLEGKK